MSDKSKDPKITPSTKTFKGAIYPSIAGGVNAILKEQARGELYPIADFYKPSLVSKALETANGGRVRVTTVQGSSIDIDRAEIKQKLANNLKALKAFYDKQKSKTLAVTYYQRVSDETAETLKQYFEYDTFKPTGNNTADIYNQTGNTRIIIPPENTKVQGSINGYALTDKPKLQKALDKLPKTKILLHKDVEIQTSVASAEANTIEGLRQLFTDVIDLAKACNIKDDGTRVLSIGDVEVSQTHLELLSTVSLTLATVQELNGDKKSHYTPPNIRDETDINYVPKPPIEAINETLMKLAEDPATEETINKLYIDEQDRIRKNGLPVRIDSLEQQALFDSLTDRGIKPIKKILDITTGLTIPAFYMLGGHLQRLQRDSDRQIEDLIIPEMSITEFMRINPRFNTPKALKKGIKAEHKEATINSLDLLRLVQYPINQPIKKNGKTVGYELSSVKVYDYSLVADKNKKIQSIKNLKYSRDFLDKYNRILAIPYGDGFYLLTEMTHQQLDIYIQGLMTNKENIKRTVANEPLIINAKEFKKIYKKYNPFDFYRTLTNGLNKLADDEIKEIDRWHTKAGGQTITSQNPDSQILYIYPTTIHKALITSEERKTIKQEQARRLRDLKSLVTKYRKDLKTNKTSSLEYLNYLAEDLEISTDELQTILAGNQPISDELMHKINELYNDFKD